MSKSKAPAAIRTRPAAARTTPAAAVRGGQIAGQSGPSALGAAPGTAAASARDRVPNRNDEIAAAKLAAKNAPRARQRVEEDEGPPRDLGALIRVRATRTGFIDNARRREGDVFDCHEAEFTDKWMERVDEDTPTKTTGPKAALERVHDEALSGKLRTAADPLGARS